MLFTYALNLDPDLATSRHAYMKQIAGTDDQGMPVEGEEFGLEKIDDHTVKFTLKQPSDEFTFLTNLRMFAIMPEHVLKDIPVADLENYNFFENVPGTGQVIYQSEIPGERMELAINKDYARGEIGFDKLIIRVNPLHQPAQRLHRRRSGCLLHRRFRRPAAGRLRDGRGPGRLLRGRDPQPQLL